MLERHVVDDLSDPILLFQAAALVLIGIVVWGYVFHITVRTPSARKDFLWLIVVSHIVGIGLAMVVVCTHLCIVMYVNIAFFKWPEPFSAIVYVWVILMTSEVGAIVYVAWRLAVQQRKLVR